MNDTTNKLRLPYITASQAQKHVTHNESLKILDTITQLSLQSLTLTQPPTDSLEGQSWYIPHSATGLWAAHHGKIAAWQDGAWVFITLQTGWRAWIEEESNLKIWNGTGWDLVTSESQAITELGINSAADATNRLSLNSPASLFNHEGAGHQLKINKQESTDTGSVLFQTGFSARAEMGLTGDDNFNIKVTADGNIWHSALIVDPTNGAIHLPNTNTPLSVSMDDTVRLEPAIKMSGTSRDGSKDMNEGVGLFLTHNSSNNRQFVLADTKTVKGVRFLGNAIDGYLNGSRVDLRLGSNTHGVHVGIPISNTQCSISNLSGTQSKVVTSIGGHKNQTGDLLHVSTQHLGLQGDALKVRADKVSEFGGPIKLTSYSVSALPPADEAGSMIYVGDENGGSIPAFSDGTNWRRMTDRAVIS